MTITVALDSLECGWGGKTEIKVHTAITLTQNANMLPVHGQTGFGKSTLLNVMSAFMPPLHGRVTWELGDARYSWSSACPLSMQDRLRLPFGIARQSNDLPATFRLHETLRGLLRHRGKSEGKLSGMIERAIEAFIVPDSQETVDNMAAKFPHEMSGGQRQRMALACSISHDPQILFLDEPTASLDDDMRDHVLLALGVWLAAAPHDEPRAIVFVSHDRTAPCRILDAQIPGPRPSIQFWNVEAVAQDGHVDRSAPRGLVRRLVPTFAALTAAT